MCGIAEQLSPAARPGNGIRLMQASTFDLHSFQSLTGAIFMLVAAPHVADAPRFLRETVYELYCDWVLKNPFHQMDQVIKSEAFDERLVGAAKKFEQNQTGTN